MRLIPQGGFIWLSLHRKFNAKLKALHVIYRMTKSLYVPVVILWLLQIPVVKHNNLPKFVTVT